MTTDFDDELATRLTGLESRLRWADEVATRPSKRRLRWTAPLVAIVAALSIGAGAIAAVTLEPRAAPGIFAAGGTLYCSDVANRPPNAAQPMLESLGYTVTWQIEDRDAGTSTQSTTPPKDGYIVEGSQHGRNLLIVVERGSTVIPVAHTCP